MKNDPAQALKFVVIIPDGMSDHPLEELGGKTPLEEADTPNMDFFCRTSLVGLSKNIPQGMTPGTDVGCLSVFGYDPAKFYTGRGPLEAAGLGIALEPDELAFRCNLVTVEDGVLTDFCADHISTAEAGALFETLNAQTDRRLRAQVRFIPGKGAGYRNLMICRAKGLSDNDFICTPPHDILGREFKEFLPEGPKAESLIRWIRRSEELFRDHPVNVRRRQNGRLEATMIWPWGQGRQPQWPTFYEKHKIRGAVIAAADLVKGVARFAGLDVVEVPGVTGYFDTNYKGKAEYALAALRSHDLVVLHVSAVDEASHKGDGKLKARTIEDLDRWVLGTLREGLEGDGAFKVLLLPDHGTLSRTRTHTDEPVPFFIYSSQHQKKGAKKFSERSAAASGVLVEEGHTLMSRFFM